MLMKDSGTESSAPMLANPSEMNLIPTDDATESAAQSSPRRPSKKQSVAESGSSPSEPVNVEKPRIEHVRVFYATDRQWYHASNPHLWITAIAPGVLSGLITCVLLAGCLSGSRRWTWGLAACLGFVVSFVVCGQSIIKVGQLMRLAQEGSSWYGTSRFLTSNDYPLHLGTSDVSLPPNHRKGMVERPSVFSFEFEERADRHVMVHQIETLDPDAYFSELTDRIARSADRSALVYIHGYNVEFDEALQRTAQLSKDIDFQGAPILYSWPSHGQLLKYRRDEANVEWSVAHLERFLTDVHRRTGVKQLHVIAHSMGNRALLGALQLIRLRYPDEQPMLGQVILAAPDMDADLFRDRYAEAVNVVASRATLYASANDRALLASVKLHGHRRLGLTSSPQPTVAGVDHVDVSPVDTSLLGHSYYGSHPLMIRELMSLVHQGIPPEQREWLTTFADRRPTPLWHFIPELAAQALSNY
jgi:esterase/lipase superfamily enzyme